MSLPRRYFKTASAATTTDVIRSRDAFKIAPIDNNDLVSANVIKDIVEKQDLIIDKLQQTDSPIGDYQDFLLSFNLNNT